MVPSVDNNHVAEGLAYFTDHYRNQTFIPAWTATYLRRIQDLENVFWQIIDGRLLANSPTGLTLTYLGKIVGQPRGSYDDVDMLAAVKLRILANKSNGLSNDIIRLAQAIAGAFGSGWAYWEIPQASFGVGVYDVSSPDVAQSLLHAARSGGTYGVLGYTTWKDAGNNIQLGSIYDAKAGQSGLGSIYDSTAGGPLAASRAL